MSDYKHLKVSEPRHTISTLCKVCGVTRAMVINFEKHGLIDAIWVNEESGYRYYGAQSVARIRHIRSLQKLGLSLEEINHFIKGDEGTLRSHLNHLDNLKKEIEEQIQRTRALLTPIGDFTVQKETLPAGHFAMASEKLETSESRFLFLWRFTADVLNKGWQIAGTGGLISILHQNPSDPLFGMTSAAWTLAKPNSESVYLKETEALSVNVKGSYSLIPKAIGILKDYAKEQGLPTDGNIRLVYLSSPQSHKNPENYVTRVFLEINS